MAQYGLVRGDGTQWRLVGSDSIVLRGAATALAREGAIAPNDNDVWLLTELGRAMLGPSMTQRTGRTCD